MSQKNFLHYVADLFGGQLSEDAEEGRADSKSALNKANKALHDVDFAIRRIDFLEQTLNGEINKMKDVEQQILNMATQIRQNNDAMQSSIANLTQSESDLRAGFEALKAKVEASTSIAEIADEMAELEAALQTQSANVQAMSSTVSGNADLATEIGNYNTGTGTQTPPYVPPVNPGTGTDPVVVADPAPIDPNASPVAGESGPTDTPVDANGNPVSLPPGTNPTDVQDSGTTNPVTPSEVPAVDVDSATNSSDDDEDLPI